MKRLGLIASAVVLIVVAGVAALTMRHSDESQVAKGGPVARTEKFEKALIAGDCPAFKKLIVEPDQISCAELGEMSESVKDLDEDAITYTLVESGKDSATVELTIEGEKQRLDLVK